MKKPSTLRSVLLLLLIIPYTMSVVGVFSSYFTFYHRSAFQTHVSSLNNQDLHVLVVSVSEFENIEWIENEKEFEYNGKMYDVAKIEHQGDKYQIYCENDFLEDLLITLLKTGGKSKCKVNPSIQFIESLPDFQCNNFEPESKEEKRVIHNFYYSIFQELITPPPRLS